MKMVPISENLAIAPPLEEARYLVVCDDGTDEIVLWTNAFADRQWRWFGLPEGKTVVSFQRVALD